MGIWYLLFDGGSSDGMGEPDYAGRTNHKEAAREHFEKVDSNPFSTGKVMIANDFEFRRALADDFKSDQG